MKGECNSLLKYVRMSIKCWLERSCEVFTDYI